VGDTRHDALDQGSLPALLASRARQASDRRLVVDAAAGVVLATLVIIFRPPLWISLGPLAMAFAMFGVWGILDRELHESGAGPHRVLRAARGAVLALGSLAGVFGAITLFFSTLGLWKS